MGGRWEACQGRCPSEQPSTQSLEKKRTLLRGVEKMSPGASGDQRLANCEVAPSAGKKRSGQVHWEEGDSSPVSRGQRGPGEPEEVPGQSFGSGSA